MNSKLLCTWIESKSLLNEQLRIINNNSKTILSNDIWIECRKKKKKRVKCRTDWKMNIINDRDMIEPNWTELNRIK